MAVTPSQIKMTVDNRLKIAAAINLLSHTSVMVGFPAEQGVTRTETGAPTNAYLAYIHEHGSPEHNLPARPFLKPGVASINQQTQARLRNAAMMAIKGNVVGMMGQLNVAGGAAVRAVKIKLRTGPFAPLAMSTIIARLRKTQRGQRRLRNMRKKGVNLLQWGAQNMKPLIDTTQMLNAVKYVIRKT